MADGVDHTHGDTGNKPPQTLNFQTGGFPDPEEFDWFWSEVPAAINNHKSLLEAIDSNGDGVVDTANVANSANSYKGTDIDSDGDGKVDAADTADVLQGNSPSDLRVDVENGGTLLLNAVENINFSGDLSVTDDGDGTVTVTASTTVDTRIDVDDPQNTVSGTNIDTLEIGPNIDLVDEGGGRFRIEADDDATTYKGNDIDSNGDGKVNSADVADSAKTYKGNDIDSDGDGTVDNADAVDGISPPFKRAYTINGNVPDNFNRTISLNEGFITDLSISVDQGDGTNSMSVNITYSDGTSFSSTLLDGESNTYSPSVVNKNNEYITQISFSASANNPDTVGTISFAAFG